MNDDYFDSREARAFLLYKIVVWGSPLLGFAWACWGAFA